MPVVAPQPVFEDERHALVERLGERRLLRSEILGMQTGRPAVVRFLHERAPGEFEPRPVHVDKRSMLVAHPQQHGRLIGHHAKARLALLECCTRLSCVRDVAKHEQEAGGHRVAVANAAEPRFDNVLCAVACDQHHVLRRIRRTARLERKVDPATRVAIERPEDLRKRTSGGLVGRPPGQYCGAVVHERDVPLRIGRNHRLGDRLQRYLRPVALRGELGPRLLETGLAGQHFARKQLCALA